MLKGQQARSPQQYNLVSLNANAQCFSNALALSKSLNANSNNHLRD